MTAKKIKNTVIRLGGTIEPCYVIKFPDTFRLNNKNDALDLMNILINYDDNQGNSYTVNLDEPLNALKIAIEEDILYAP